MIAIVGAPLHTSELDCMVAAEILMTIPKVEVVVAAVTSVDAVAEDLVEVVMMANKATMTVLRIIDARLLGVYLDVENSTPVILFLREENT